MPVWILSLLSPRMWMVLGAVVFVGAVWGHGYYRGHSRAAYVCEQKAKKAVEAANAQDLQAEKEGRKQDLEITEALTQQKKRDDETIEALRRQVAARPAGSKCEYDKDTADPDDNARPARRLRK